MLTGWFYGTEASDNVGPLCHLCGSTSTIIASLPTCASKVTVIRCCVCVLAVTSFQLSSSIDKGFCSGIITWLPTAIVLKVGSASQRFFSCTTCKPWRDFDPQSLPHYGQQLCFPFCARQGLLAQMMSVITSKHYYLLRNLLQFRAHFFSCHYQVHCLRARRSVPTATTS